MPVLNYVLIALLLVSSTIPISARRGFDKETVALLDSLDKTIKMSREFERMRIKGALHAHQGAKPHMTDSQLYDHYNRLFNIFYAYQYDSARHYNSMKLDVARRMGNHGKIYQAEIMESRMNTGIGAYHVSRSLLDKINPEKLDSANRCHFYETSAYVYSNIAFNAPDKTTAELYARMSDACIDSLLALLNPGSMLALQYRERLAYERRDLDEALKLNDQQLAMAKDDQIAQASIAFNRYLIYDAEQDTTQMLQWLVKSAISDIRSGIMDNASLSVAARILFDRGDIARAHEYLCKSMADAITYNTPYRKMQLSGLMRTVDDAYLARIERHRDTATTMVNFAVVLLIIALTAIILTIRQLRQAHKLNRNLHGEKRESDRLKEQLVEANDIKEATIKTFLSLSASNIIRLSAYRKQVCSMLAREKYAELQKISSATDFGDTETEEFYEKFDNAVMMIFPDFVEKFNSLFKPEFRVTPKKAGRLTPEMRIVALMRLGVESPEAISRLLNYSMSTVYNYRVKMRKRVVDESKDFDDEIKKILRMS